MTEHSHSLCFDITFLYKCTRTFIPKLFLFSSFRTNVFDKLYHFFHRVTGGTTRRRVRQGQIINWDRAKICKRLRSQEPIPRKRFFQAGNWFLGSLKGLQIRDQHIDYHIQWWATTTIPMFYVQTHEKKKISVQENKHSWLLTHCSARIGESTCYTERRKTNREVRAMDMGAVVAEGRGSQLWRQQRAHGPLTIYSFFAYRYNPTCELATALCPVKAALGEWLQYIVLCAGGWGGRRRLMVCCEEFGL